MKRLKVKEPLKILFFVLLFVCCRSGFAQQTRFTINGQNASPTQAVSVCVHTPVTFENTSTGAFTDPRWVFKGGNPLSGTGNTVTNVIFSTPGTDSATLIVTRGANSDTLRVPVLVVANNVAAEFISSPSGQCANVPVSFTNQSTGGPGLAYNWVFDDPNSGATQNASTQTNPTHRFVGVPGNNNETFGVRLIARNTIGCADTVRKDVTVRRLPGTQLLGSNATNYQGRTFFRICTSNPSGDVVVINHSSTAATNTNHRIKWGDGSPDFTDAAFVNQTRNFPVGIYDLAFIVTGGNGCIDTANYGVFVGSNPAVGLGNPGNTSICTGSTLTFPISNTATNPPGTFYTVTFNDGSNPLILQHPAPSSVTHQFDRTSCGTTSGTFPNSFQATITATNPCLSSQANVVPIYVSEKARAVIGIGPRDTVCTGITVNVNDNSGNVSFINGSACSDGSRVWSISPSTGYTVSGGTFGSDNNFPADPSFWINGTASFNLNFTQPGIYTLKLRVGNPVCGRDSVVRTICVNPAPAANFTASTLTGCAPLTVSTSNTSNSPNCETNSYQWSVSYTPAPGCTPSVSDFTLQGGTTLTSAAPVFRFNNPGTYTVSLVTRNSGGICASAPFTQQIVVKDKPNANFTLPVAICQGGTLNLNATSNNCGGTTATSFNWVIPGGNPAVSTVANPGTIQFNTAGNPTIRLTATNECGATTVDRPLLINPTPEVSVPADTALCRGQVAGPFTFTAQPANATITWTNTNTALGIPASGSGNINTFTISNVGNASITVSPVLGTCTGASKTFAISVNPLPAAPVVPPVPNYCVGDVAQPLNATALPGHTLQWYPVATGGTALPSAPTPATLAAGTTSWWVSQVVTATGCEGPRSQVTVTVFAIPTITNAIGNNPTTCAANNGSIVLSGLQPNASYAVSYSRNGVPQTATLSSNATGNITIAALLAGVYDNIRVSIGGGCASAPRGPISLSDPNPPATPVPGSNGPLCVGNALNLTATSATPGALVYTWSGPNGFNSNLQNPSIANVTQAAAGIYSVTARLGNCTSPAGTVQVAVNPTPTVTATSNSPVCSGNPINLSASSPSGGVVYAWTGPDNFSSAEQNPTIANAAAIHAGTYRVTGTLGACPSQERTVQVVVNPTPTIGSVVPFNPTNCATATGSIQLTGLGANTSYTVTYSRNGIPQTATIGSNAGGNLTIPNLVAGTYSNIQVGALGCISAPAGPIALSDPNPPAAPQVSSNSPLCIGSTIRLMAAGVGAGTYQWTGPNGFSSSAQNPEIPNANLASSGNYLVTFTVSNCTSAPATVIVSVSQNASIPNAGPDQQLCNATQSRLQAGTLANGTGTWTIVPGSAAQVVNTSNPATDVTGLPVGLTRLVWTVTNNVCPPARDTVDIINLPPVTQALAPRDPVICEGQSVTLIGTAPTGGTGSYQYQWQQSSNNISFTNIPDALSPDYVAAPTVNTWYRRQVTSGACQHLSDTILVTVRPSLGNNRIAGPVEICINTAPSLITGSTPTGGERNYTYTWELSLNGGSTWSIIPNATGKDYQPPVLTQTTSYRRIVRTALCQGPQALASDTLTITVRPDALLVWQPTPLTGCTPFTINHTRLGVDHQPDRNSTYRWYVNGIQVGTGLTFPGHTLTNAGDTAEIKAVAVSRFGCKNDSTSVVFRTISNPSPSFTLSDTVGCGPLAISFTNTTPNLSGFTYRWDFGNGQQSPAADPGTVNFARNPDFGDTLFTIILHASNGCDTLSVSKTLRVRAPAKAIINPDKVEGCSPARFAFSNNSRGSGATYSWNFGDGTPDLVSNEPTIHYTYNTGVRRIYQVRLISRNDCGTDTARVNLVVSPNPIQVNILADANRLNGCAPHTVQFINNTIGATTFRYNFGDGTPDVVSGRQFDTILHVYSTPGTYTFSMTASSGCTDTAIQRTVVVQAQPVAAFTRNTGVVCIGEPVLFTNNSSAGAAIQWSFGDGTGSGLANPQKSFTRAGTYRVTLYASTNFGLGFTCTDSASTTVIVRDTLPGNFTVVNSGNCAPFAITFKTSLTNAAATFWNFGDGTTATGDSVAHSFISAGTYTVTMVSVDAGGCAYKAVQTVVVSGPTGQLVYQAPFVCVGSSVTFRAISNNTARYIYYFGNGDSAVSLNSSFTYTYPQPGTYRPHVVLQSGNCRSEIWGADSLKVDRVRAGFVHQAQPDCGFTTLQFTENGTTIFGKGLWQWQLGNGNTSIAQNPTNVYTSEGVYNVKLVLTGISGCKDSLTLPVRVDIQKIPKGTILGDTVGCIGQMLRWQGLVDNADTQVSFRWLLGDGREQIGGATLTASYPRGGSFTVSMITQTNFGCSDTARRTVQVSLDPLVNAGPDLRICKGETVQLRATGAATYQWSPSTWLSCADCPNPMLQATENITYVVTGFNSIGCKATDTLSIEVPQPFRIAYSASDTICLGEDKQLQVGGAQRYVWSPGTGLNNATIANPVATPTITTTYRVVGYDNANCFTDTGYVTIEVGRIPTVDIGDGGTFVAGTIVPLTPRLGNGPFARYAWTPTTGLSCADCPNPIVTVGTNITYTMQVTSPLGCSASDTVSFRVVCVQAEQVYIPNAFSPDGDGVNDVFMVRGKGLSRVKSFRVFNRFGQVVFEKQNFAPNDPAHGWNGKINGVPASPDVYVYVAELLCTGGASYFEKGNVTLVR